MLFALDLLCIVNFGGLAERADSVLSLFGRPIPLESLSGQVIQEFLNKLAPTTALDGHWIDTFLANASKHYAGMTAGFFMRRVEHAADQKDWSFRPCNYGPFAHIGLRFRESAEFSDVLRRVVSWMGLASEGDFAFNEHASQLFEAMFGLIDERIVGFLGDWLDVATPAELQRISAILNKAGSEFIFHRRALVVGPLEKAESFGLGVCSQDMGSGLYAAAISGLRLRGRRRALPSGYQNKEKQQSKSLVEIPRFSPAYELYEAIRKHAEREIERCRKEAELFED